MASITNSIESANHPLAFPVALGAPSAGSDTGGEVRTMRVEARLLNGHQKELLVAERETGDVWRLVSDEGPNLNGSDLAPFPLAFFNAAMHADFLCRVLAAARAHNADFERLLLALDNHYAFSGSFFRGTGEGAAEAVTARVRFASSSPSGKINDVLRAALAASPVHDAFAQTLTNVFALYVNGRRCPVVRVAAAGDRNEIDPFSVHLRAPVPLPEFDGSAPVITRLDPDPDDRRPKMIAAEGVVPITIRGSSEFVTGDDTIATTVLPPAPGARFELRAAALAGTSAAPSATALAAAGVTFCYMTQLARYIEHRKYAVQGIRVVQTNRFTAGTGTAPATCSPFETHVFLNADESDDVLQTLLETAENTCYLHAALRAARPTRIDAGPLT